MFPGLFVSLFRADDILAFVYKVVVAIWSLELVIDREYMGQLVSDDYAMVSLIFEYFGRRR
jgi:hypothetical protein